MGTSVRPYPSHPRRMAATQLDRPLRDRRPESAVSQAKAAAAGKSVGVHGADTIQQCLNAGLLDEIDVDIAAVLLGSGVRLFDHLAGTPAVLGNPTVIPGVAVTHMRFAVREAQ